MASRTHAFCGAIGTSTPADARYTKKKTHTKALLVIAVTVMSYLFEEKFAQTPCQVHIHSGRGHRLRSGLV